MIYIEAIANMEPPYHFMAKVSQSLPQVDSISR